MSLVIKEWYSSEQPNQNGEYVYLHGREGGLISWILSVFKIDPTSEVRVQGNMIKWDTSSLAGSEKRIVPIRSITSAYYGYEKPWKTALVITAIGFSLTSVSAAFLLIALAGPVYYFLNKSLTVGIVEKSGWTGSFSFKRSVIEGQNISEEEAYKVIDVIRGLIESKTT